MGEGPDDRDKISRMWFDATRVDLEMVDDVSLFLDEEALVGLSGAMSDSKVTVRKVLRQTPSDPEPVLEAISLHISHPAVFSMTRLLRQDANHDWYVENAKFRIRADYAGRGLAARSLTVQARAAQQLGFRYIALDAVGDYTLARLRFPEDRWVGYWVWPRLGFDANIPESTLRRLPEDFQNCRRVAELMDTDEGLNAWELYGETLNGARFDLTAGSTSWQLLAKYSEERNIKV